MQRRIFKDTNFRIGVTDKPFATGEGQWPALALSLRYKRSVVIYTAYNTTERREDAACKCNTLSMWNGCPPFEWPTRGRGQWQVDDGAVAGGARARVLVASLPGCAAVGGAEAANRVRAAISGFGATMRVAGAQMDVHELRTLIPTAAEVARQNVALGDLSRKYAKK